MGRRFSLPPQRIVCQFWQDIQCEKVYNRRGVRIIILLEGESVTGLFKRVEVFDKSMAVIEAGQYEAPTAVLWIRRSLQKKYA